MHNFPAVYDVRTTIMEIYRNHNEDNNRFTLTAENGTVIAPSEAIKVLAIFINSVRSLEEHVSHLRQRIGHEYAKP